LKTVLRLFVPVVLLMVDTRGVADAEELRLAAIFGDNMVLQRDVEVPIWGWAAPGDLVTVEAREQKASTSADKDGRWMVKLRPLSIGKPFDLVVQGPAEEIVISDVVAGEVWICSGQSNMEWTVDGAMNPAEERKSANFPMIRHVKMNHNISTRPLDDGPNSGWQVCSPETAGDFTAVGYFFARKLHQELDVPIGLINTSWGGTIVEAWISGESLKSHPDFTAQIEQIGSLDRDAGEAQKKFALEMAEWQERLDAAVDQSMRLATPRWDDSQWPAIKAPGVWEKQAHPSLDGIAWYRKKIEIPPDWVGRELSLSLAMIDDADQTFVNGEKVGGMDSWQEPRQYVVPARLIKDRNVSIAICVNDTGGDGGIHGREDQMRIGPAGGDGISLAGDWKFSPDEWMQQLPPRPQPPGFDGPNNPTALHNAMIQPLIPYAVRGAIWYQGESNAARAYQYRELFPLLIQDWRRKWNREMPFYWVQLTSFMEAKDQPGDSAWAELREAQSMALGLPHTGQAVTIDVGQADDIHPKNKQDVGLRLALHALHKDYKQAVEYSGPMYKSMSRDGDKIRLSFDFDEGLRSADGKPLKGFAMAGSDRRFYWAEAQIAGDQVVVSSAQVGEPVAVRYAWADNADGCNLTNQSGLPASPFRTDTWPGVTASNR
jgi:sialate O-acetylesterase